ncbi:hypothetical protein OAO01_09030, partial [Oligoflexia bacterium]|nr:hypothetical protein [Oligoflexia bacterium]
AEPEELDQEQGPIDSRELDALIQEDFPTTVKRDCLRLQVLPIPARACVVETYEIFETRYTRIEHASGVRRLGEHTGIHVDIPNSLEIAISDEQGRAQVIELPEPQASNLLQYLVAGPPTHLPFPFECSAFMHYLHGVPYTPGFVDGGFWSMRDFNPKEEMAPGQAVIIGDPGEGVEQLYGVDHTPVEKGKHWAMHLSAGWYLSKIGLGSLIVATISDMQKGFQGSHVWALQKRETEII